MKCDNKHCDFYKDKKCTIYNIMCPYGNPEKDENKLKKVDDLEYNIKGGKK